MLKGSMPFGMLAAAAVVVAISVAPCAAQEPERRRDCGDCPPAETMSWEPQVFHTQEQTFRVVPMKGLNRP